MERYSVTVQPVNDTDYQVIVTKIISKDVRLRVGETVAPLMPAMDYIKYAIGQDLSV